MKPEVILKKAIKKAVKNGWKVFYDDDLDFDATNLANGAISEGEYHSIIFNHEFLEAFFGKKKVYRRSGTGEPIAEVDVWDDMIPEWKWHAQQMVISKDPLKYLAKYI